METYYAILEIPESATPEEIKQAYRLLIQVWHPDRFQHSTNLLASAEQKTKEINAAFDTLSTPALKQRYDEELRSSRARQEQRKPKMPRDDLRTTRCPNPTCNSVLRVNAKTVAIVTCPSCRTTFRYDPERNEQWDVKYPDWHRATEEGEEKPDPYPNQTASTTPTTQKKKPLIPRLIAMLAIFLVFAVVAIVSVVSNKPATTDEKEKLSRSVSLPESAPLAVKEEDRIRRAGGSIGFPLENGDELVPAIFPAGAGTLTVVNETAFDAVVKLVEEGRDTTLMRYWFVESKKAVTLDAVGSCDCSLYFGLGKEWDHNTRKFRLNRSYGKYKEPLTFTETKMPDGIRSQNYTVKLEGAPGAIAQTSVVDEVTFNELF